MKEEFSPLLGAIKAKSLPASPAELFGPIWDSNDGKFISQETYIIDYKETVPSKFGDDYGTAFVRLAIAFYNTYGGIIVIGVKDRELTITGIDHPFDIESFNRSLSDATGHEIECVYRSYTIQSERNRQIAVVLVPQRGIRSPARQIIRLSKYEPGALWVRDRHQVVRARPTHIPLLYTNRDPFSASDTGASEFPIHKSFPPSPSTIRNFIGREGLLLTLWDWFVFGDKPRVYLHGPGGSGKSTLAYEFARSLSANAHKIVWPDGDRVDYIIYISGKETELNTYNAKEQTYKLQQFTNASEQFLQIAYHSGLINLDDLSTESSAATDDALSALFQNFSGLIVIDDIDALSRRNRDTGEESLFMKALLSRRHNKILYTLRSPPGNALQSAIAVPGLDPSTEFFAFTEACCEQFHVTPPPGEIIPQIQSKTSALPLLIETVIGLRRVTSNYSEAIEEFGKKGGDDARRYLYQREYDRLDKNGRSREILAALSCLQQPVTFSALSSLFGIPPELVRDALSECGSIFLTTEEDTEGNTRYQLTDPSVPFISSVSDKLRFIEQIRRKVEIFLKSGGRLTAEEFAMIIRMRKHIRSAQHDEIINIASSMSPHDTLLANPQICALIGQAYAKKGGSFIEKAREHFRLAEAMNYADIFMMRAWFNMELQTGYNNEECIRICNTVLRSQKQGARYIGEFWGKAAHIFALEANNLRYINPEKATDLYIQSICAYLEGLWVGRDLPDLDDHYALTWLERTLRKFVIHIGQDIEPFFDLLERLPDQKHDVSEPAVDVILSSLALAQLPNDSATRKRIIGLSTRAIGRIRRSPLMKQNQPSLLALIEQLDGVVKTIDRLSEPVQRNP